jgi:ribosome-interacting GTPase 1
MPANLPPTYHEAEDRYRSAGTTEEKIAALEEMLRIMPKHKGTDKLQADLKARIAKLRRQPKKKLSKRGATHVIPNEGAGQVVLLGPPNTGKSALVARLTRARPEVADYPYTTREPVPGMMPFEDIAFQLIDLPPLSAEYVQPWLYDLIRRADLVWMVVEPGDSLDEAALVLKLLEPKRIALHPAGVEPEKDDATGWTHLPTLLVVTGMDRPGSDENLEILKELLERPWPLVPVSTVTGEGLDTLTRRTFEAREIVRVYTKQPGKPPDRNEPFTLGRGSTVADLALSIHKDIREKLKFARVWGESVFDGQTVQQEHVLEEGDVVELHC